MFNGSGPKSATKSPGRSPRSPVGASGGSVRPAEVRQMELRAIRELVRI